MCTVPALRAICRESYNDPVAVYEKLKRLGMDLVTVTDHDSIDAAETLRSRPDFFLSDIGDRDHVEIQRRRNDFESLSRWLGERRLFFSANHVFSSLTGRRALEDFELFETAFPAIETRNGHMLAEANAHAAALADFAGRAEVGGSDAHALASVGCAWTVVPNTRTKEEYLAGLRHGRGRVRGASGSWWKLTRDVLTIGAAMARENPAAAMLLPLGLAVPLVTLGNYAREGLFARIWMGRYLRERIQRGAACAPQPAVEAAI
jgi:predicted metal-dependent phosphoesterase TrpH